ncbi:MAG: hypothetical protein ABI398_07325 [Devosia sp.]
MRLIFALLLLLPVPAFAADYVNVRYGYAIAVPDGFIGQGESDNGDGQMFKTPTAKLTVYGGNVLEADFESEVVARERFAEQDGWGITYNVSTPDKASYSAKRGARILYSRMIALCGGTQFAAFEFEYSRADLQKLDPIVDRLVRSFKGTNGGC